MISLNTLVGIFFILVRREFFFLKNLNLELCCHCTEIDNSPKVLSGLTFIITHFLSVRLFNGVFLEDHADRFVDCDSAVPLYMSYNVTSGQEINRKYTEVIIL